MTQLQEFYQKERAKWDGISAQKLEDAQQLMLKPGDTFIALANRDSVMYGVADFLGDITGKRVLEVGCGSGKLTAMIAKNGTHAYAFDLSPVSANVAQKRAELNDVADRVIISVAAGEDLPYANESFDIVFGRAILHHLDVNLAGSEIYRVLKPGGKAVFIEPMGMNPVLNFVRDHVPYPNKNPVGEDQPLNYKQIRQWGMPYERFKIHEVHLLGMIERAMGYRFKVRMGLLHRLDRLILRTMPFMGRFYRYVVLFMEK